MEGFHSGDIVDGGDYDGVGASEFLDTNIDLAQSHGAKYIVYQIYSYTCQHFSQMEHAMFGWMNREDVNSGEIYEPSTVEQKINLSIDGTVAIPVIFDCEAREMIWCDLGKSISNCTYGGNNLESNLRNTALDLYSIINMHRTNMYELAKLHVQARGVLTKELNDADVIFDVDKTAKNYLKKNVEIITPDDIEIWVGQLL